MVCREPNSFGKINCSTKWVNIVIGIQDAIPSEPYLLKIHNNVVVAAGVSFHTHDVLEFMFSHIGGGDSNI